jgi:hypothetical protein
MTGWQRYEPAALYPGNIFQYSFMLEAEKTHGHDTAGRISKLKKFNGLFGRRTATFQFVA